MFGGAHKEFNHLDNWNLQLLHTKLVNIDKIMGALAPTTVLLASPLICTQKTGKKMGL